MTYMAYIAVRDEDPGEALANFIGAKPQFTPSSIPDQNQNSVVESSSLNKPPISIRNKQVTFGDIFNYALPSSSEVIHFNDLIEHIWSIKEGTSLIDRDDSKISKAIFLISDILDIHWDEFSTKTKVLLLNKLQPFNESALKFILKLVAKFPSALSEKLERNKSYASQYNSLDPSSQKELYQKSCANSFLLIKSIFKICTSTSKVFKKDGCLLEKNKDNLDKFNYSVRTMLSARRGIKDYRQTLIELAK